MKDLSIIILSFNTADVTEACLKSVYSNLSLSKLRCEVIVVENASKDNSAEMLTRFKKNLPVDSPELILIMNEENVGYPHGNNQGISLAQGKYILLLNSDTLLSDVNFEELIQYLDFHEDVGVLTVRVELPNGSIDPASHRGFPTPWNSFTYFAKLEKIFGSVPLVNRVFGGYHLTYMDLNKEHEIDLPVGAFYLTRSSILKKLGGFDDKNFFMYGEDVDLTYRIKKMGYRIVYYPKYKILHLKHTSGIKTNNTEVRTKTKQYFYDAMEKFYRKHYAKEYPFFINHLMYFFIRLKKSRV